MVGARLVGQQELSSRLIPLRPHVLPALSPWPPSASRPAPVPWFGCRWWGGCGDQREEEEAQPEEGREPGSPSSPSLTSGDPMARPRLANDDPSPSRRR
jgi:hypothetical protein